MDDEGIPIGRLKGLKLLFENDLYELALFKLKVHLAQDGPNQVTRTTIHGLLRDYEYLAAIDFRRGRTLAARYRLPLDAPIVPDEEQS
jgi:hypothetical protein